MPKWKSKAFNKLPAYRSQLQENIETPYLFFGFLHDEFTNAVQCEKKEEAILILNYIRWCIESAPRGTDASNDIFTFVMNGFVEHIPDDENSYSFAASLWPRALMVMLRDALTYHGNEEQYRKHALQDA